MMLRMSLCTAVLEVSHPSCHTIAFFRLQRACTFRAILAWQLCLPEQLSILSDMLAPLQRSRCSYP